jgi:RNA polymerase sigma factor (sigma-70 family)
VNQNEIGKHIYLFLKNGDKKSFEVIYIYYHDKFLNYIIWFARSRRKITREDAEEICNDLFVQIWRKRHIFKIKPGALKQNFENWLYMIARFKFLDFGKKRRPDSDKDNLDNESIELPLEKEPEMEQEIVKRLELLAFLSDEEKDVLFLHFVIEIPFWELAIILNKKESKELVEEEAIKETTRLRKVKQRALKKLKKRINGVKLNELSKERLKKEAIRLKDACQRILQKIKELVEQKPEYRKALESKIEILESFINDLDHL